MSGEVLNERAQHLLKVLIERYIRDGQPVGSRTLAEESGMSLSSATVRNVMADLEEQGLVVAPHTSAGRVPTVQGYRLFVDSLLSVQPLEARTLDSMEKQIGSGAEPQRILTGASSLLAELTSMAGVVMLPRRGELALQRLEFLPLSETRVLVILVISDSEVQNRIIHTERPFSAAELQQATNYLNQALAGKRMGQVRDTLLKEMEEARQSMNRMMLEAIEMAQQTFADEEPTEAGDLLLSGETQLMDYAEMADMARLRRLFDAFNQKRDLLQLLDRSLNAESMQIFIGSESGYGPLDDCSVIASPYGVDGETLGVLGVIGPTRMNYQRVIPIVDVTAKLLGAALNPRQ